MIRNIRIEAKRRDYMVVLADSDRFGNDEVIFEGNTFNQCFDYVKKILGVKKLHLTSSLLYATVKDREGRSFPWFLQVG